MSKIHYKASCHCGELEFSFYSEEIKEGVRCNCSICIRRAAIMSKQYIPHEDFTPITNTLSMNDYRWGDKVVNNLFCKTCGIYPYHGDEQHGYRVNLGCVANLDPMKLKITIIDGKSMPLQSGG